MRSHYLLPLLFLWGCPPEAPPPPPPSPAAPTASPEEAEQVMLACISGSREPLQKNYEDAVVQAGSDAEYAKAEAAWAFERAAPVLREGCRCMIDLIGGPSAIVGRAKKAMLQTADLIKTELGAIPPEKLEVCIAPELEKLRGVMPTREEADAFKAKYGAMKEPKAGGSPSK
jgi:hypothetical protein